MVRRINPPVRKLVFLLTLLPGARNITLQPSINDSTNMRFNVLVTASFFVTLAVGLVIPDYTLSSRNLEVRDGLVEDTADILVREPLNYVVPAGGGKPAQTYSDQEVDQAVADANAERILLANGNKKRKKTTSNKLKKFNNFNHARPQDPAQLKPFPSMTGLAWEYPLPNKSGNTVKGPARVILQKDINGIFHLHGVVAHDQSRAPGTVGYNDHFPVVGI